jgi:hypothetical protein
MGYDSELLAAAVAGAPGVGTTWNPADKRFFLTLSNGDLTATHSASGGWQGVRAIVSSSTAKWYFETTNTIGNNVICGIAKSTVSLSSGANSLGITIAQKISGQSRIWSEGAMYTAGLPWIYNILMCAVDLAAQKIWFGNDGVWWNSGDPASGANPIYSGFPSATYFPYWSSNIANDVTNSDFGQSPTYPAPAGFGPVV